MNNLIMKSTITFILLIVAINSYAQVTSINPRMKKETVSYYLHNDSFAIVVEERRTDDGSSVIITKDAPGNYYIYLFNSDDIYFGSISKYPKIDLYKMSYNMAFGNNTPLKKAIYINPAKTIETEYHGFLQGYWVLGAFFYEI